MGIQNAVIAASPTSIVTTGGTNITFSPLSNDGANVQCVVSTDTDSRLRRKLTVSARQPKVQVGAPNGFTQSRHEAKVSKPKLLANGKITTNEVGVYVRYDPETTQAEIDELTAYGAQLLSDADFTNLWRLGSVV